MPTEQRRTLRTDERDRAAMGTLEIVVECFCARVAMLSTTRLLV